MKKIIKLIGIVLGVIVVIVYWMSRPSKGVVKIVPAGEIRVKQINIVKYEDENILFEYMDKYIVSKEDDNVKLIGKSGIPSGLVVTLMDYDGVIEDVSGVKMRQIKKDEYKEEKIKEGMLFIKESPFEVVMFKLVNGKSLTVAMVVNSNETEKYRIEFDELVKSIRVK